MSLQRKHLHTYIAIVLLALISLSPLASWAPASAVDTRDCDTNAVLECGALTTSEMLSDYDKNVSKDLPAIYTHYGIARTDIAGTTSTVKTGTVTKTGDIIVDGKVIATGARTVGRHNITGSTAVKISSATLYERTPAISFNSSELSALVYLRDGEFYRAILMSCGNPVTATPKQKTTPPPTTTAAPAASCTSLTVKTIARDQYSFDATATASDGAKIKGYTFSIKSDSGSTGATRTISSTSTSVNSGTFTLSTPGDYTARVEVDTSVGVVTDDTDCVATFTVAKEDMTSVCNPTTGKIISVKASEVSTFKPADNEACKEKPATPTVAVASTGPTDLLSGAVGAGSLAGIGFAFRSSRQRIFSALKRL